MELALDGGRGQHPRHSHPVLLPKPLRFPLANLAMRGDHSPGRHQSATKELPCRDVFPFSKSSKKIMEKGEGMCWQCRQGLHMPRFLVTLGKDGREEEEQKQGEGKRKAERQRSGEQRWEKGPSRGRLPSGLREGGGGCPCPLRLQALKSLCQGQGLADGHGSGLHLSLCASSAGGSQIWASDHPADMLMSDCRPGPSVWANPSGLGLGRCISSTFPGEAAAASGTPL